MKKKILVTGGLGYIGSHTVMALDEAGYEPIIIDNLSNSNISVLDMFYKISGKIFAFYNFDIQHERLLQLVFDEHKIHAVIHFAASKYADESIKNPIYYLHNNVGGLISVVNVMRHANVSNIIFSSSCAVYGSHSKFPVTEKSELLNATSPYAYSKQACEYALQSLCRSNPNFNAILLRYFNPIGAHPSGKLKNINTSAYHDALSFLMDCAITGHPFPIFGSKMNTHDGTCLRDFIHVMDVAQAHVRALSAESSNENYKVFNIGSSNPTSILELASIVKTVTKTDLEWVFSKPRPGDIPAIWADIKKATKELKWAPKYSVMQAVQHAWRARSKK